MDPKLEQQVRAIVREEIRAASTSREPETDAQPVPPPDYVDRHAEDALESTALVPARPTGEV